MKPFEDNLLEIFNIPKDCKHDHTEEALVQINNGIEKLNLLLRNNHQACINHMVKYTELNVKFFFMANLLSDRRPFVEAFDLFIHNMRSLFKMPAK